MSRLPEQKCGAARAKSGMSETRATSIPCSTRPNTVCLPSSQGQGTVVTFRAASDLCFTIPKATKVSISQRTGTRWCLACHDFVLLQVQALLSLPLRMLRSLLAVAAFLPAAELPSRGKANLPVRPCIGHGKSEGAVVLEVSVKFVLSSQGSRRQPPRLQL